MREIYWVRAKAGRLFVVCLSLVTYMGLLIVDASYTSQRTLHFSLAFGFSAFVALLFLAVGTVVWLYARNRQVALLLFCFSSTAMTLFALETSGSRDPLLGTISGMSSALAFLLCALFLLRFPKDHLPRESASLTSILVRSALGGLVVLCCLSLADALVTYIWNSAPLWLNDAALAYFTVVIISIFLIVILSYYRSSSLRERQQLQFLVSGVVLAFSPLLVLTVLPRELHFPQYYRIDPQLSTLSIVLLPLSLGYSILRYQILIFDASIRRAVTWIVGTICLAILSYLVVVFSGLIFGESANFYILFVAGTIAVLAPCCWWVAKVMTEHLFFSEIRHYRRLIDKPAMLANETLDLEEAAQLLTLAAVSAFETAHVCLFVLDEGCGYYRVAPSFKAESRETPRLNVMRTLLHLLEGTDYEQRNWVEVHHPAVERIALARRPLLLSEVITEKKKGLLSLEHALFASVPLENDMLLAPVRAQGKMIAILVLGEREDHQGYAGPDFEVIQLLTTRFSSLLETARLYARTHQHAALLNSLYGATTMAEHAFLTVDEVATTFAVAAATATNAHAEIWMCNEGEAVVQRRCAVGDGPSLVFAQHLRSAQLSWSPYFYEGKEADIWNKLPHALAECLMESPTFPFAWLPLQKGQEWLGLLVLTYARPHFFMREEMRVLEMFARQCATALENAHMTLELREAYERQKELDRLKDQFIVTASHELRTPLTAVQGYIELLSEYNTSLSVESRANFIAKAHRGCDELTLMVGNIMDASRVQIDAEHIKVRAITLLTSVIHVVEILEAMTRREQRTVTIDVVPDLLVYADDMRLRQVLLNLVSNALKYSPLGTPVEIRAQEDAQHVNVAIRDYGAGVPQEDQPRLFERFVRLDRDMNSPVRGAGLGLYICKQLVEAMGGRIWVESSGRMGEGSIFAFTLKRVPQQSKEVGASAE